MLNPLWKVNYQIQPSIMLYNNILFLLLVLMFIPPNWTIQGTCNYVTPWFLNLHWLDRSTGVRSKSFQFLIHFCPRDSRIKHIIYFYSLLIGLNQFYVLLVNRPEILNSYDNNMVNKSKLWKKNNVFWY